MTLIRAGLFFLSTFSVVAFGAVQVWSESVIEIGAAVLYCWHSLELARCSWVCTPALIPTSRG
jgi:hypothetical protein